MSSFNIFNTDCLAGMTKLENQSVDFILTDLPYGLLSYKQDKKINLAEMWEHFKRILKPRCVVALFASNRFSFELVASNMKMYKYKFVWIKNFSTNFINAKNRPLSKYEEILIFSNGACTHDNHTNNKMKYFPQNLQPCQIIKSNGNGTVCLSSGKHKGGVYKKCPANQSKVYREQLFTNYPSDVLYFNAPHSVKRNHPNEKPVDLLEYLIKTYSNEGETVLDATMGSGSTGVACINTNRNFIGFEIEENFFNIAQKRLFQLFLSGGDKND